MSGWTATSTCLVFCETVCCTLIMNPSLLSLLQWASVP